MTVLFTSGDQEFVDFKTRYQKKFLEEGSEKVNFIEKVLKFQYAEWIYEPIFLKNKYS